MTIRTSRRPTAAGGEERGRYARLTAGAEAIEVKAIVADRQIGVARRRYRLDDAKARRRLIYFFDTPRLELLAAGVIARVRREPGGDHDSTIKFRPVDPARVDRRWRRYDGFKIEADASEQGLVKSASFSVPVEKGLIKAVVAGERNVDALYRKPQEAFLRDVGGRVPDFARLAVLGPLEALRWDFEDPAAPWRVTAELWRREDGDQMLELSVKAPAAQAAATVGGFMAFLAEVGAERDLDQQAKTRWALDYYAKRLAARPGRAKQPLARRS